MLLGEAVQFRGGWIEEQERLEAADFDLLAGKIRMLDRRPIDEAVDVLLREPAQGVELVGRAGIDLGLFLFFGGLRRIASRRRSGLLRRFGRLDFWRPPGA